MPPFPPPVRTNSPGAPTSPKRSPLRFFLTVAALSIPFAWFGAVTDLQLYPGIPVAALAFVCPVFAAALLSYRENGAAAVSALLRRAFDFRRMRAKVWYVPTVFLMPCVTVAAYGLFGGGIRRFRRRDSRFPGHSFCSWCSWSPRWVRSWGGRDTPSTRCRSGGAPSTRALFWEPSGPCGT